MATRRPAPLAATGHAAVSKHKKRAEALLDRIGALKATIARSFYELGAALKELHDDKLHVALGLKSFDALLAERVGIAHATAYELMAVVSKVPKKLATSLGAAKAYDLVRYAAAEHESVEAIAKRPVASRSARAIREATRDVKTKADPARKRAEIAAKQLEHRLERAGSSASIAVHLRGKEWRIVVDLSVDDAMLVAPKA
jgi:hypothetical protein